LKGYVPRCGQQKSTNTPPFCWQSVRGGATGAAKTRLGIAIRAASIKLAVIPSIYI
jgi:hypothetical protein